MNLKSCLRVLITATNKNRNENMRSFKSTLHFCCLSWRSTWQSAEADEVLSDRTDCEAKPFFCSYGTDQLPGKQGCISLWNSRMQNAARFDHPLRSLSRTPRGGISNAEPVLNCLVTFLLNLTPVEKFTRQTLNKDREGKWFLSYSPLGSQTRPQWNWTHNTGQVVHLHLQLENKANYWPISLFQLSDLHVWTLAY